MAARARKALPPAPINGRTPWPPDLPKPAPPVQIGTTTVQVCECGHLGKNHTPHCAARCPCSIRRNVSEREIPVYAPAVTFGPSVESGLAGGTEVQRRMRAGA